MLALNKVTFYTIKNYMGFPLIYGIKKIKKNDTSS